MHSTIEDFVRKEPMGHEDLSEANLLNDGSESSQFYAGHVLVVGNEIRVTSGFRGLSDIHKDQGPRLDPHRYHLFCAKELSVSITASESTRTISSILIGLLVVLSYIDYPLLGVNIVNSKSIIAMRPLYLLLVTEFTILMAHLVLVRRRRSVDFEEYARVSKEGVNWERAVSMLERGVVAHQTIRGLFIDCSVYVVIVVCGLSLL